MAENKDPKNIGLSEAMHFKLKLLEEKNYFSDLQDGYRLAASIAIFKNLDISNLISFLTSNIPPYIGR